MEKKDDVLILRVTSKLKKHLSKLANEADMRLSEFCRSVLEKIK